MHAILVTFDSSANLADLQGPFTEFAHALNQRDGFVMKTWLSKESIIGGFYIFADRDAAERYVEEMLRPVIDGNDAFDNLNVRHFGIIDELSSLTGTPLQGVAPASAQG